MAAPLHPDVQAALGVKRMTAVRWDEVSTIRGPWAPRSAFRIELADGRTVKARRLEDAATARRLYEVQRELPDDFSPATAVHGPVLIEAWLEGRLLSCGEAGNALLRDAGRLLARVHNLPAVAGRLVQRRDATAPLREDAERGLHGLVVAGALDVGVAAALRRMLADGDPGSEAVGVTHNDFCGENMLIDPTGRLRVFDNDRVSIGPLGYDLGRAWHRWALPPDAWTVFELAYRGAMPASEPFRAGFWGLLAVVTSAGYHLRLGSGGLRVPLDRLDLMAEGRQPGTLVARSFSPPPSVATSSACGRSSPAS